MRRIIQKELGAQVLRRVDAPRRCISLPVSGLEAGSVLEAVWLCEARPVRAVGAQFSNSAHMAAWSRFAVADPELLGLVVTVASDKMSVQNGMLTPHPMMCFSTHGDGNSVSHTPNWTSYSYPERSSCVSDECEPATVLLERPMN
jgi:hypothetical protein